MLQFARVARSSLFIWSHHSLPWPLVHNVTSVFWAHFSGDKAKIQKMVQMAWTFINDRCVLGMSLVEISLNIINLLLKSSATVTHCLFVATRFTNFHSHISLKHSVCWVKSSSDSIMLVLPSFLNRHTNFLWLATIEHLSWLVQPIGGRDVIINSVNLSLTTQNTNFVFLFRIFLTLGLYFYVTFNVVALK